VSRRSAHATASAETRRPHKLSRAAVAKARDDMLAEACLAHCNERTSETATLTD
jgi:hypothetical protein